MVLLSIRNGSFDWGNFFTAGATVGTPALLLPHLHFAWQKAHGIPVSPFIYVPAAAWIFWPEAHLPIAMGLAVFATFMAALATVSALLLARIYCIKPWLALVATFAWVPTATGILVGQQACLGLFLETLGIVGMVNEAPILSGLAFGLLLYKPTLAIPFIVLLAARRAWQALIVTAICAIAWYALSIFATAGDITWPVHYLHQNVTQSVSDHFMERSAQAISVPKVLAFFHAPTWLVVLSAIGILIAAAPIFARASALEAASLAPLVGALGSVYIWSHDLTLLMPTLMFLGKRWTTFVMMAYALAATWVLWPIVKFNPEIIVVVGLSILALLEVKGRKATALGVP
ncbi:MAG TPA: glycosyltransferase family 87 protein [Candidatus Baltobacteraceae bacterium]|jgi:hypothetical protein|nr:glycosyltransferase family 87 protein [Candidatus Baltobacteraceae bacterium]